MIMGTKGVTVDLSQAVWRKSTRSGPFTDNCVEVAFVESGVAVRDSKDRTGPMLFFTRPEWDAFVGGARTVSSTCEAGRKPVSRLAA
jgi:hypothetical protein